MGEESFSQESLNSKLSFYILFANLHLPLNLSVSEIGTFSRTRIHLWREDRSELEINNSFHIAFDQLSLPGGLFR